MKQIGKRLSSLLLSVCMALPMLVISPTMAVAASEEFFLPTGQTYYFDLSSEVDHIGTINSAVPDATLHYVPFTYVGTINAYNLDSSSSGYSSASDNAIASDRSLFVADYNLSHSVSWNTLNGNGLIYGKTYDTNYTLRSLSMGNVTEDVGSPITNEWDRILDKDDSLIKNWSIRTWGQDTYKNNLGSRSARGGSGGVRYTLSAQVNWASSGYGFRPALEVMNAGTLGLNGLKVVTVHLNGGSLDNKTSIQVVRAGGSFTAPSGTGLTPLDNMIFGKWNTEADGSGTSYGAGASVPDTVTTLYAQWEPTLGDTFYFDLSGEAGHIGTVNTAVPDPTLHYVPFTYTGTVNAYSLDSSSSFDSNASANATASNRSLFVADYVVSHTVSWDTLNANNLIFGKTFDTNYTLRSLSGGSKPNGSSGGTPTTNEWDQILNKNGSWIKNWPLFSLMQDTGEVNGVVRASRGFASVRNWVGVSNDSSNNNFGFRPALEVRDADTWGPNGLKAVRLELGGGSMNGENRIHIISGGDQFTAPSGTGLTPPEDMTFVNWQTTGDPSTTYAPGQTVAYTNGMGLTAVWEYVTEPETTPVIEIDYDGEQLTGFMVGGSYTIDGAPAAPVGGVLDVAGYIGTTIAIVKKGNGTTTTDSLAQNLIISARPATPTATGVDPTTIGGTGKITGVTTVMEYKSSTGAWTDATGTEIVNLDAGIYQVRVKATTTSFKSAEQIITLTALTPMDSTISPTTASFDKKIAAQADVTTNLTLNGNTLVSISNGTSALVSGTDYTAAGNTVSIKKSYMVAQPVGTTSLTFTFSGGADQTLAITVSNTTLPGYTVTYSGNGATSGSAPTDGGSYAGGVAVAVYGNLGNLSKTGYTFAGWNTQADGDGANYAAGAIFTMETANVTLYAKWKSSNADLSGLTLPGSTLSPTFAAATTSYTVNVRNSMSSITVTAMVRDADNATVAAAVYNNAGTITSGPIPLTSGAVSPSLPLNVGINLINLVVTAEDGTTKTYEVTVNRASNDGSSGGSTAPPTVPSEEEVSTEEPSTEQPPTDTNPTIAFRDIDGHWAEAYIKQAASIGIVAGYPDGTFKPNRTVTRTEFTVMLMNTLKLPGEGTALTFTDTAKIGSWAQKAVAQAVQAGIISGYEDGSFRPDAEITRAEMAMMLANASRLSLEANAATGFADDRDIPAWARGAVSAVKKRGLIQGKGSNEFDPDASTTRAEAATVLMRMLEPKS
ncbi:hypothetical protein PAECIP111893_03675 [Paenibacillus plantiphilus]|uniref:SLH domain-containing protein n=1 Tax=Paenibacillus plantiphilus TaxID=2905650 RepID=A0ABM9CJ96_9BACL|nr:S-layer homology domain-containing protein [Paenibacillus plantiphilus]CAH1213359.1 hypothetical protein PAECIP111893_03675 [Paenibacillus plantiphilus]